MKPAIYLDYAATSPLDPEVLAAMLPFFTTVQGNPSSLHTPGKTARKALTSARETVAQCLGGSPESWCFTASGTEANNMLLSGWAHSFAHCDKKHLITSPIEHPSVLKPVQALEKAGWEISFVPVDEAGVVSVAAVEAAIRPHTKMASLMHGNNEVGTLQNIEALGHCFQQHGIRFHTDAVQTTGKVPLDLNTLPVDALTLSAHKFYGPKGVGALYINPQTPITSLLILGGGQESGQRSGTENLAAIVGLSVALERAVGRIEQERPRLARLQKALIEGIQQQIPGALLNGPRDLSRRVPGNVNFSFPPLQGESLVLQLDLKGIAASSGSACHSALIEPSHVLLAMGRSMAAAQSSLRFSLGQYTVDSDIEAVLSALVPIIQRFSPNLLSHPSIHPS